MFFLHWRKMTWAIWIWSAVFIVWIIAAIATRTSKDCAPGDQLCTDASDTGTGIAVVLLMLLWFLGFVVLSLIWFMTRPKHRECPACGSDVKKGLTTCRECGYDFAAALRQHPPDPAV